MSLKYRIQKHRLLLTNPFTRTYTANICKHKTKAKGLIHYYDEECIMTNVLEKNGNPDYCFTCLGNMTIRCAWCEKPITIGEAISLRTPCDPEYKIPEHAVKYKEGYVGCLRASCSDGGMDRAGFWIPPGEVERVPTMLEMVLQSGGKMVVIQDLSNPNDLGTIV